MKVLKQFQKQNDRKSLVKELIALRPISPVVITETHPLETLYVDTNPPPQQVDQFAPYLSRKLTLKRQEKINKIKGTVKKEAPTFALTAQRTQAHTALQGRRPALLDSLPSEIENDEFKNENRISALKNGERTKTSYETRPMNLQQHIKMEEAFDKIASGAATEPLHKLIESTLQIYFLADSVFFYHDIASVKVLYCPTTTGNCPHGSGIAGYTQFTRKIINCNIASEHAAYSKLYESAQVPPDAHLLAFPLLDVANNVKGIIEVVRNKHAPIFNEHDEQFVQYLQHKFKMYSRWLFQPILNDSFVSDLIQNCRLKQFIEVITEKLATLFGCREAEIWSLNSQTGQIYTYKPTSDKVIEVQQGESGIAGYSLKHQIPISCVSAKVHSAYIKKADGNGDFSVLSIPVRDPDSPFVYSVVLRGKRLPQFFTDYDEKILARIIPYVITSLNSSQRAENNHRQLEESLRQQARLRSLLEVAEILSGELHMDSLIPKIMSRACDLVHADRCSLFLATPARDKLITTFTGGMKDAIELPFSKGIVGYTASTGQVLNIKDAYEDPRFNRATDLKTGYRTLSVLCVPIFDHDKNVRGVTEMINKLDGTFNDEDVALIQIFNVFTGISLENAQLYRASLDLSLQLKTFMEISVSITQTNTIKKLLEDIIKNTRQVIGAVTAAIFLVDENGISKKPTVIDEDTKSKLELYEKQKKNHDEDQSLGVKRAIIMRLMQGKQPGQEEISRDEELRTQVIEKVVNIKNSIVENDKDHPERSMMISPILGSDRTVLGVVMMQWKKSNGKFSADDMKLLESYSVFLSISLERAKLKTIAQLGTSEVEMQTWIQTNERQLAIIPKKLRFSEEDNCQFLEKDFNTELFKGVDLVKVVFAVFNNFGVLSEFNINAETMFRFISELRASYNPVPYHNWNHAVDVMQFVAFILHHTGLEKQLTKFEIFALLVSALCHDANHDGFSNTYNVKAQTPLGILFKNQSVMETHHCSVSIGIITKEECNIFSSLSENDVQRMWQVFIDLILSTDMAKHFQYIDMSSDLHNAGRDWHESQQDRVLIMQLIIKIADISNVARKFEIADQWCAILCEEFFRQGDLERAQGMEYSSPMNDRMHLDKAKSQIGFYKNVCLPLFEITSSIVHGMDDVVDQVKSNLDKWVQRVADNKNQH